MKEVLKFYIVEGELNLNGICNKNENRGMLWKHPSVVIN